MQKWLLLFIFTSLSLFAEEEIVVQLTSECSLSPTYLSSFEQRGNQFDRNYLDQLESILRFDLRHNGSMLTLERSFHAEQIVKQEGGWKTFHQKPWEELHVHYVVKAKIENHSLNVALFSVQSNAIKGIEDIALTGRLNEDRRIVHHLADTIYEALYHKKGISSSRILFTVKQCVTEGWQTDVWESDYDGANARQITHDGSLCVTPVYVPTKSVTSHCSQFLYVSYKIGQPKIFAASTSDGTSQRITYLRGNQLMPVISPRKNMMAFISDITGNPELFIQPFSIEKGLLGKPRQIFSAPNGAQASPTFSPDGKKIAFVSNKDGSPRIYVLNIPAAETPLKEARPVLISKSYKDNTCPAWSPDGTKVAYSTLTKGVRQIWIYDFIAKKEIQLTDGYGHKENPAWAPDSLHLLFNSATDSSSELFLINLRQKEAIKISHGVGEKRFPSWEL